MRGLIEDPPHSPAWSDTSIESLLGRESDDEVLEDARDSKDKPRSLLTPHRWRNGKARTAIRQLTLPDENVDLYSQAMVGASGKRDPPRSSELELLTRRIAQLESELDASRRAESELRLELAAAEQTARAQASAAASTSAAERNAAIASAKDQEAQCRRLRVELETERVTVRQHAERARDLERAARVRQEDAAALRDLARHSGELQSTVARLQRDLAENRRQAQRDLEEAESQLSEEKARSTRELEGLRAEVDAVRAEEANMKLAASEAESRVNELARRLATRETELDAAAVHVAALQESMRALQAEESEAVRTLKMELRRQRDAAANALRALRSACAIASSLKLPGALVDSSHNGSSSDTLAAALAGTLQATAASLEERQASAERAKQACRRLEENIASLQVSEQDQVRQRSEATLELDELKAEFARSLKKVSDAESRVSELQTDKEIVDKELKTRQEELNKAHETIASLETNVTELKQGLDAKDARIRELRRAVSYAAEEQLNVTAKRDVELKNEASALRTVCSKAASLLRELAELARSNEEGKTLFLTHDTTGQSPAKALPTMSLSSSTLERAVEQVEDAAMALDDVASLTDFPKLATTPKSEQQVPTLKGTQESGLNQGLTVSGVVASLESAVSALAQLCTSMVDVCTDWRNAQQLLTTLNGTMSELAATQEKGKLVASATTNAVHDHQDGTYVDTCLLTTSLRGFASTLVSKVEELQADREGLRAALRSAADERRDRSDTAAELGEELETLRGQVDALRADEMASAQKSQQRERALERENQDLRKRFKDLEGKLAAERAKSAADWTVVRKDIADLVAAVETAQKEAQRAVQSAQREAEKASAAQPTSNLSRAPLSTSRPSPIPLSTPPFLSSALSPGPLTDGLGTSSAARAQPRHWHSLLAST